MKRAVLLALLLAAPVLAKEDRAFHPVDVATMAAEPPGSPQVPTKIQLRDRITYKKVETDGTVHLRMGFGDASIALECIPEMPAVQAACRNVRVWSRVDVQGISHWDSSHGGWELHPVLRLESTRAVHRVHPKARVKATRDLYYEDDEEKDDDEECAEVGGDWCQGATP